MEDIRFGIIGCGDVTEKKSGPAFNKVKGSKLIMVMRRDEEKLKDYARRHHIEKFSTDYTMLLKDAEVDAIYIATPPKWHHFYVLEAARYKKAIYVEKPMAMTVAECEEMIQICKEYEVPLFVAYYRRGQEKFNKVKALMTEGAIGELRSFHYVFSCKTPETDMNRAWLLKKEEAGGGLLYDIGSHMLDIILYFFGEVKQIHGYSSNQSHVYDVHDNTSGMIVFESGVSGSLQLTFNCDTKEDKLVILGSEGKIELSIMSNEPVLLTRKNAVETLEFEDLEHVQQPFIQRVVDCLHHKITMDTTGIDGLKTQRVLEILDQDKSNV